MAWNFCTSGSAIAMAGNNADTTLISYAGNSQTILDGYSDQSEGEMEMITGITISGSLASFVPGVRQAIGNVCASKIAMKIINYAISGYTARESDTLLNVNTDIIATGLAQLKDYKKYNLNSV